MTETRNNCQAVHDVTQLEMSPTGSSKELVKNVFMTYCSK